VRTRDRQRQVRETRTGPGHHLDRHHLQRGQAAATNSACSSACFFDVTSTAAAGTYRLQVDPQDAATGAVSVRVYTVPADAAATATIGAAGPTVSTTVPGQNAVVSFAGPANRVVTVAVSRATFTGTTYTVRKPDGSTLSTKTATDVAAVYPAVLADLLPAAWHHVEQYANNPVEADHRRLKHRLRPMRGLRTDRTAQTVITGHGFVQNLRRGHYEIATDTPPRLRLAAVFAELATAI
jgi:hypothetical protein